MRYRLQQRLFADCETNLVDLPAGTIITVVRHVSLEQIEVSWEGGSGLIFTVDLKSALLTDGRQREGAALKATGGLIVASNFFKLSHYQ